MPQSADMTPRADVAASAPNHRISRVLLILFLATTAACGNGTAPASLSPSASANAAPTASSNAGASGSVTTSAAGTPAASQDLSAIYQTIEDQTVEIRQLQPKRPVQPTLLDDAGIKKLTRDQFDKDNPPAEIAANERMYKALGMLPADASLHELYVELLGSQVAGLYDPSDKHLYVVAKNGTVGPAEKVTFSHEFTHALQDQNFDLGSLKLDEVGHGDQSLARLSLVEGDATVEMSIWQTQHLTAAEQAQILAQSTGDPSMGQLLAMPPILRESLLFPYIQGLTFVGGLVRAGSDWSAVNAAYKNPPASTEQILHPEKYSAHEQPIATQLPAGLAGRLGAGWSSALEDTFGEFQFQVWLAQNADIGSSAAEAAAAGWGGDRIAVLDGPNDAWGVVLRTEWDTAKDASEFESAAGAIVAKLGSAALLPGAGGTERWVVVASDSTTLGKVANAAGLAG
jgi:hypothetical protein